VLQGESKVKKESKKSCKRVEVTQLSRLHKESKHGNSGRVVGGFSPGSPVFLHPLIMVLDAAH
jgi:hypothetical protein